MAVFATTPYKSHTPNTASFIFRCLFHNGLLSKALLALIILHLIAPVASMDNLEAGLVPPVSTAIQPPGNPLSTSDVAVGGFLSLAVLLRIRFCEALRKLVPCVMGGSSVVFVMIKNDASISPEVAWA